jgi:ABC-type transporter Mla subunit MlaD
VRSLGQELDAARESFQKAEAESRIHLLAAVDARERFAAVEEKARQMAVIEKRALEADSLEERGRELEASLKAMEERLAAAEARAQESDAAAESARLSTQLAESARSRSDDLLKQSIEQAKRLEAEVEKLKAQDIERQGVITDVRRLLADSERNAGQLQSKVAVLESEVTRTIDGLGQEIARREAADGRLSAAQSVAASIADAVLGAGSSTADPIERLREVPERLREQRREIASSGLFLGARQALGVVHSHLPSIGPARYGRGFVRDTTAEQQRRLVEGASDPARAVAGSVSVNAVLRHWEAERQANVEDAAPEPVEGAAPRPQQPGVPASAEGTSQQPQQQPPRE